MSLLSRLGYYFWYFRNPPWDSGESPPELLAFLTTQPAGRALDMGCGTGTNVIMLTRLGWEVDGIDFIPSAIDQARKKCAQAQIRANLMVGDVTTQDRFTGPYNLVLDIGCFHSLSVKEKNDYLCQLDKVLAHGGAWFLYAFVHGSAGNPISGLTDFDLEQISSRFMLKSRTDGFNNGNRRSAYFIFNKR